LDNITEIEDMVLQEDEEEEERIGVKSIMIYASETRAETIISKHLPKINGKKEFKVHHFVG